MKIEKLNDDCVRITYSAEDLDRRGIVPRELRPDSDEFQDLIYDVIDHAEIEMGEEGLGPRIKVETAASEDGSCSVTVTRDPFGEPDPEMIGSPELALAYFIRELLSLSDTEFEAVYGGDGAKARPKSQKFLISFGDFEALLDSCSHCHEPAGMPARLYTCDGAYHLLVTMNKDNEAKVRSFANLCTEFGGVIHSEEELMPVINERGKKLISRAAVAALKNKFGV